MKTNQLLSPRFAMTLVVILFLILFGNGCNSLDDNQKQVADETGQAQAKATTDDLINRTNQRLARRWDL